MAGRKFKWWKAVGASLLFVVVISTAFYHHKQITRYYYKAYRLYKRGFHRPAGGPFASISYPEGYNIHGIDISHYQEYINWAKLKTISTEGDTISFRFAYMKATEGTWKEDRAFDENWEDAHAHHVICGAYHYFLPGQDAKKQADNYISSVTLQTGDLPPVIDIEDTRGRSKQEIVDGVKTMAKILEAKYGAKPIIYSNISFIEDYLSDDFPDYYFWVAHYYQEDLNISPEINWLFWQHNDKGRLFGADQNVDVDVFNGNMIEFRNILVQTGGRINPAPK
jgi:lysozyme